MAGQLIRVGVSPWANLLPQCIRESLETDCYPGFELEVFRTFSIMLNLSLRFVYSPVPGCGYSENDSLVAMLQRNEIDITGNLCNLRPSRVKLFQPSVPVLSVPLGFLLNLPGNLRYEFRPLAPFENYTWCFIAVIFLGLFVAASLEKILSTETALFAAFYRTAADFIAYTMQFRTRPNICRWMLIVFMFAFLKVLYSCGIRDALMNPFFIRQPFEDQEMFLNLLAKKQYRLIDYKQKDLVRVHGLSPANEQRLQRIIDAVGYVHVQNDSDMLSVLAKNANGLLAKNVNQVMQYLADYEKPFQFWRLSVTFGSNKMVYLWNRNFSLANKINLALIELTGFAANIEDQDIDDRVKMIKEQRIIKPPADIEGHRSLRNYSLLFICYGMVLVMALAILLLEKFSAAGHLRQNATTHAAVSVSVVHRE